jgi:multimeric flavodoxin WrbA
MTDTFSTSHNIVVVVGSPRPRGVSNQLARQLVDAIGKKAFDLRFSVWRTSDHRIAPCDGCETCRAAYRCRHRDDMDGLTDLLDAADQLLVVCPVYFAGPPAQFKAVLDRLQPYWERRCGPTMREEFRKPVRPASIVVVGEGSDPHGYEPLIGCVRSALGAAGFSLDAQFDAVGWRPDAGLDPRLADAVYDQIRQGCR